LRQYKPDHSPPFKVLNQLTSISASIKEGASPHERYHAHNRNSKNLLILVVTRYFR